MVTWERWYFWWASAVIPLQRESLTHAEMVGFEIKILLINPPTITFAALHIFHIKCSFKQVNILMYVLPLKASGRVLKVL